MKTLAARAISIALILMAGAQPSTASPASLSRDYPATLDLRHIPLGARTFAPFAYTRFCVLNPQDCERAAPTTADHHAVWKTVRTVNLHVNRTMRAVNESRERWTAGGTQGDCEDFALTKRRELIRLGVPASALRIATARTAAGEGHAVLVVKTSAGDFILDNLTNRIVHWNDSSLRWIKIASAENPRVWHMIGQQSRPVVSS